MRFASQIALVLMGRGINTLVGLLFLPYLARAMDKSIYGTYGQTLMVTDLFKVIFALGLAKIITIHLAKYPDKHSNILGSNLILGLCGGLLAVATLWFTAPFIAAWFENPILTPYLQLYLWGVLLTIVFETINTTLIYFGKIRQSVFVLVSGNLIRVFLVVLAVQLYDSLYLVFCGMLAASILQIFMGYYFLPIKKWTATLSDIKEQIKDGIPLGLSATAAVLANIVDGFMVSIFLGTTAYATYRNGVFPLPFLSSVYQSIALVMMPALAALFFKKEFKQIISLKRRIITQAAALTYPVVIFLLVFHKPIIVTYLSEKYAASAIIFFIYNIALFWRINYYQDVALIAQKTKFIFLSFLLSFGVNVGLNCLLIPQMGIMGAALSTLVMSVIISSLLFSKTISLLDSSFSELVDWKKILKIAFIPLLFMPFLWMIHSYYPNIILLAILGGISILMCYFWYLKKDLLEQKVAFHFLKKIPIVGERLIVFFKD